MLQKEQHSHHKRRAVELVKMIGAFCVSVTVHRALSVIFSRRHSHARMPTSIIFIIFCVRNVGSTQLDECAAYGASACGPNAQCSNTHSSFTCTCNAGFDGGGAFVYGPMNVTDPPNSVRAYSGHHHNNDKGPLGSDGCWRPGGSWITRDGVNTAWTRIDLGEPMLVVGIIVRKGTTGPARAQFEVSADFSTWTDVDGGAWIAPAAADETDDNYVFGSPAMARYVRAYFDGGICFSLGLLTRGMVSKCDATAVPTPAPIPIPTATPTAVPTPIATAAPTAVPTPIATAAPTAVPTPIANAAPTAVPTPIATAAPTAVPTPIATAAPTAVPTPIATAAPTAVPTPSPTSTPLPLPRSVPTMPAAPQPAEVQTYTARVRSTITLAGMAPAQFTAERQLTVRKVFAANTGVHFNYITITDVRQGDTVTTRHRRLDTTATVSFTLALCASPATTDAVETSVMLMAAQESALAAQLNEQLQRDGHTGAGLSLRVIAVAAPVELTAPAPLYVVFEPRLVSAPVDDPAQPSLSRAGSLSSGTSTVVLALAAIGAAAFLLLFGVALRRCGSSRSQAGTRKQAKVAVCEDDVMQGTATGRRNIKLFLSYGRGDASLFARWMKARLERDGFEVWFDEVNIGANANWQREIGIALRSCDGLVAVLNSKYAGSSFCKNELCMANAHGKPLFPLLFRDFSFQDLPPELEYPLASTQCIRFHAEANDAERYGEFVSGIEAALGGPRVPVVAQSLPPAAATAAKQHGQGTIYEPSAEAGPPPAKLVMGGSSVHEASL